MQECESLFKKLNGGGRLLGKDNSTGLLHITAYISNG